MTSRLLRLPILLLAVVALASCDPVPSGAKRKSQPALVAQRISATKVTVTYNRPSARGRPLFGGIVKWGEVWDPGADEATTFQVSRDVRVNGQPLPRGKYSVWAVPDSVAWTVIFSRAADVYHTPYPEGSDALRLRVRPRRGPYVESLSYAFPVATPDSAVLHLAWGETVVPLTIHPRTSRRAR
jgi:hypothetical protein